MATSSSGPVKRGMRDYVLNLDGVNEQSIVVDGDFFHVQNVAVAGTNVLLRFDDGPQITRGQGEGNRVYYSRVTVSASAATQATIQLGYGYATDGRATVNANVSTTDSPALHNVPLASVALPNGGAATQIAAADANSLGVLIGLASTAANGVWIGDNTVAANLGLFIEPGQIVPWPSQAAVYGSNPGGAAVSMSVVKFSK
ncbi:MAG: hypothetical protein ACREU6_09875, partial [Steroidobacteraceae bacterium]